MLAPPTGIRFSKSGLPATTWLPFCVPATIDPVGTDELLVATLETTLNLIALYPSFSTVMTGSARREIFKPHGVGSQPINPFILSLLPLLGISLIALAPEGSELI